MTLAAALLGALLFLTPSRLFSQTSNPGPCQWSKEVERPFLFHLDPRGGDPPVEITFDFHSCTEVWEDALGARVAADRALARRLYRPRGTGAEAYSLTIESALENCRKEALTDSPWLQYPNIEGKGTPTVGGLREVCRFDVGVFRRAGGRSDHIVAWAEDVREDALADPEGLRWGSGQDAKTAPAAAAEGRGFLKPFER